MAFFLNGIHLHLIQQFTFVIRLDGSLKTTCSL